MKRNQTNEMKHKMNLFACVLSMLALFSSSAQETCCSATTAFAQLGTSTTFQGAHQLPQQPASAIQKGSYVEFQTPDNRKGRGYLVKAASPSAKYIFVFHEWWGLNQNMVNETERWAQEVNGVNVIALDLYDGKVATTREAAAELMQAADEIRIRAIIQGALEYAGEEAEIATLGWCFGGGWSMQAALMMGNQAVGCVVYYGMPERDSARLASLNCKVLGIFAERDMWINRKVVAAYEKAMNEADKAYETYWYDAEHAFANPSNAIYDEAAAADAREKTREYLRLAF